jgi:excisionase family DNA binding protein
VSEAQTYVLTEQEVSERLKVPVRTVQYWRRMGRGPAHFKAGRHVRYSVLDVETWIAENMRPNGSKGLRSGLDGLSGRLNGVDQ